MPAARRACRLAARADPGTSVSPEIVGAVLSVSNDCEAPSERDLSFRAARRMNRTAVGQTMNKTVAMATTTIEANSCSTGGRTLVGEGHVVNRAIALHRKIRRPSSDWTAARANRIKGSGSSDAITPTLARSSALAPAQSWPG